MYTKSEENPFAGFSNLTNCGTNLWKFLGAFLLVPYFQDYDRWVPLTWGYTPYFILGSYLFS